MCSACQIFELWERYVQMLRRMRCSIICWHLLRVPCSTTCLLHNTRYATKQQHSNMDAVTLKLSCRAYQFSQKPDRAAHRCDLAGELTDVIVSTASEQTSAFCLAPDLINDSILGNLVCASILVVSVSQIHIREEGRQNKFCCLHCGLLS